MPYCAVLECKNDSRKFNLSKGGITYHRFPKDPYLKEKWIDATGRQNWFPAKSSTICSNHFLEIDFVLKNSGNRYINDGAIPLQHIFRYQSTAQNHLGLSVDETLLETQIKNNVDVKAVSPPNPKATESHSSTTSTPTKKELRAMLRFKENKIKNQNLIIRKLREQNRRLKKKNTKIEDVLKILLEKVPMDSENLIYFENTNIINKTVGVIMEDENSNTPKEDKEEESEVEAEPF